MIYKRKKWKLDFIKMKNFCSLKDIIKKKKKSQARDWEKIFVRYITDGKDLYSEYIKILQSPIKRKQTTQV